ncbi:MAG: hypothetical protein FK732_05840 [Asgard group archaeon]|nr:hypothetical protein [Asgard group archaeon]
MEQKGEDANITIDQINAYFKKVDKWPLISPNYSEEQERIFQAAVKIAPQRAIHHYTQALIRLMEKSNNSLSNEHSFYGVLDLLGPLVQQTADDTTKIAILRMMDEHMQTLLQFSIKPDVLNKDPKWHLESEVGLLPVTINLLIHMLGSRSPRTILESARTLALLAEVALSIVLDQLVNSIGIRDDFFDKWILEVLLGLAHQYPSNMTTYLPKIMYSFRKSYDLVIEFMLSQLQEKCGRKKEQKTTEELSNLDKTTSTQALLVLPPKRKIIYQKEQTAADAFVGEEEEIIESYAEHLAEASDLQKEYIESRIFQEAKSCSTVPNYNFSAERGIILSEKNFEIAAGKVAQKLLAEHKVNVQRKTAMVQALRGVDTILLTKAQNSFPSYIHKLTDDGNHQAWLNGAELQTYDPFQETDEWKVLGCCYEQATEHRFEHLVSISCLVPKAFVKEARKDKDGGKRLYYYRQTFGLTLDAMTSTWWEFESYPGLPILPLTIPVSALIPIVQAMLGVAPSQVLKIYGFHPDSQEPSTWYLKDHKAIHLKYWDNGDVLNTPHTIGKNEWRSWGQLWLIHKDALKSILKVREELEFTQVFRIERIIREYSSEEFKGKKLTHWKIQE